jgi:hypothetical protein
VNVGLAYYYGWGTPVDHSEAARWFRRAAEQGFSPAEFAYALSCANGDGVSRNLSEAATWYARAAKHGHSASMNNLAIQYEDGRGVARDYSRARQLYQQAVSAGYTPAATNLARLLISGTAGTADAAEICSWLMVGEQTDPVARSLFNGYCGSLDGPALVAARQRAAGLMRVP